MMRNYKTWYRVAAVLQFLTAAIHSLSFLNDPKAENETEKTLIDLMQNYRLSGLDVTMSQLMTALSACMTFVFLFGALVNGWMLRRTQDEALLGGILAINLLVFGALFVIMLVYAFLPPIVLTGLVFFFLLLAFTLRRIVSKQE